MAVSNCAQLAPEKAESIMFGPATEKAFSLTWSAAMQIYRHKRKFSDQKKVQLPQTGLEHQQGRRFTVLGHQYGGRDVVLKRSIERFHSRGQQLCKFIGSQKSGSTAAGLV